jgi:hypothetical protein
MKVENYTKGCHPQCPWCAQRFWAWLKSRMFQMDRPMPGESVSFNEAAVNSASRFRK